MKATAVILFTSVFLGAAGVSRAGPAATAAVPDPPSTSVWYADRDLRQPESAAALLKRIRKASAAVCNQGSSFVGTDSETVRRRDECFRRSLARAVAELNAPLVTQAYGGLPPIGRLATAQQRTELPIDH